MFDLLAMKGKGINWAKDLPKYCRVLNEEKKEELGWLSPFKVYYGRKSNVGTKASLETLTAVFRNLLKPPKRKDLSKHHMAVKNIRKRIKSCNRKLEKRMTDKHMRRNHPPTEYRAEDKVLLRLKSLKGRIAPKRRHVLKGRVVARNVRTSIYKVIYRFSQALKQSSAAIFWNVNTNENNPNMPVRSNENNFIVSAQTRITSAYRGVKMV